MSISDKDREVLGRLLDWENRSEREIGADKVSTMLVSEAVRVFKVVHPTATYAEFSAWAVGIFNRPGTAN